jgi:hypothetical protein
MVSLTSLWLPILLSAVVVFIVSSIVHMALGYHRSDYTKLPNEDAIVGAMHEAGVTRGMYMFPHMSSPKEMNSPEMLEKYERGPVGILAIIPSGPPAMGKLLALWFVYTLIVSFFAAYLAAATLAAGTHYLGVFRVVGTAAFLAYGIGYFVDPIWKGGLWSVSLKNMFDGLVYALFTAGVFGWLWP